MSSEPAVKISQPDLTVNESATPILLWQLCEKREQNFSLYLSLYVLGLSVCSDSIVLPLSLFYSLLSTGLSETWASQILGIFST